MPRFARIVVPGVPHHITQRGNNQQVTIGGNNRGQSPIIACRQTKIGIRIRIKTTLSQKKGYRHVLPRKNAAALVPVPIFCG